MSDQEESKLTFSNALRGAIWLNTFLACIAVLAMIVLVNYVAAGHFRRFQIDRNSSFKLSPQTTRVLDSLTNNVEVTMFFEPHGQNEEIYSLASALLTEYQQICPRFLHVHTLDYDLKVGDAKEFLAKHSMTGMKERDFVLFDCAGHTKVVYARDLAQYDFSDLLSGKSKFVRRNAFLGEMFFTEDIFDVANPRPMTACFLSGEGENDPDDTKLGAGFSKFAQILKDEVDCNWEKITLQGTNVIPPTCQLLIAATTAREGVMTSNELDKVSAYLKQGGRLLALLTDSSGLENVLAMWGVGIGDSRKGRIMDMDKGVNLNDGTFLTAGWLPHPIMDPLASEKMPLRMVYPRGVYPLEGQSKVPGAPSVSPLAATSLSAMSEAGQGGQYSLAVAVEQGGVQGVNSVGAGGTRIVVVGDSTFLDNAVIDSVGNHLFAHQALSWLLQRPQLMLEGLGPRPIREFQLHVTQSQVRIIRWLFLAAMPAVVLLLGLLVWMRRRS